MSVIHFDSPEVVDILPSNDIAVFNTTKGFFFVMYLINTSFNFLHLSSSIPTVTSIPASCNFLTPFPDTKGLGSTMPMTTLLILFSIIWSTHGGVFP